jgi:hypothetical protein
VHGLVDLVDDVVSGVSDPSRPYRLPASARSTALARALSAPRPISRREARAWQLLVWGPPAVAAYAALMSVGGCQTFGRLTPAFAMAGILWGITAYATRIGVGSWAGHTWRRAQEALAEGRLDAAEVHLRRLCAVVRFAPAHHATYLVGLGQVAVRRGDLDAALHLEQSALASPWLVGTSRAHALYALAVAHALRAETDAGARALSGADALATPRLLVWSAVIGAYLAVAEGDFANAAARLEAAWGRRDELQVPAMRNLIQALWAFCLQRTGGADDDVRVHLHAAAPLSREQLGHLLRAWPDFDAFLREHALVDA